MTRRPVNPRAAFVALLAASVVVLGGCGDDDPGAVTLSTTAAPATTAADDSAATEPAETTETTEAAATSIGPCELVPIEEARQLLPGATLLDGVESGQGTDKSCGYAGDPNGPTAQVEVYTGAGAKKAYDIDVQLDHEFETVTGIGDESYYEDGNLFLRVGDMWVQLRVVTLDVSPEVVRTNLLALGTTVAGKL